MAPVDDFANQLSARGLDVTVVGDFITFPFTVPVGGLTGQEIRLGIQVPGDFPASPPPGPHVSPRRGHPGGAVLDSPLGAEWEYWSRPFQDWPATSRTAEEYLAHVRTLFAQV